MNPIFATINIQLVSIIEHSKHLEAIFSKEQNLRMPTSEEYQYSNIEPFF